MLLTQMNYKHTLVYVYDQYNATNGYGIHFWDELVQKVFIKHVRVKIIKY